MWRVKFVPVTGISIIRLEKADVQEVQAGEERVGFLPRWYLDELGVIPEAGRTSSAGNSPSPEQSSSRTESSQVGTKAEAASDIPAGWNI